MWSVSFERIQNNIMPIEAEVNETIFSWYLFRRSIYLNFQKACSRWKVM